GGMRGGAARRLRGEVSPPGRRPLRRVVQIGWTEPANRLVVRRRPHELRVVVGLVDDVGEYVDPLVDVLLRPHLARFGCERLGDDPRLVTEPEGVDAEVDHPVLHVYDRDAGLALHRLEAVASHLAPRRSQVGVRSGDAAYREQPLLHVVVREYRDVGGARNSFGAHRSTPGVGVDELRDVAPELADLAD